MLFDFLAFVEELRDKPEKKQMDSNIIFRQKVKVQEKKRLKV